MATYLELANLYESDSELRNKLNVSGFTTADTIVDQPSPTDPQKQWAAEMYSRTAAQTMEIYLAMLAAQKDLTVEQIRTKTDDEYVADVGNVTNKYIQSTIWPTTIPIP